MLSEREGKNTEGVIDNSITYAMWTDLYQPIEARSSSIEVDRANSEN
jgi:hypothetical protein